MKIPFYILYGLFGLLGVWFVASSLVGHYVIDTLPQAVAKSLLLAGAASGGLLLYRAYQVGEVSGRYGAGTGWVLAAVVSFQLIQVLGMVLGGLLRKWGGGGAA
jgi:hypothetical protein